MTVFDLVVAIRALVDQEQRLQFEGFDELTAHRVGESIRASALSLNASIVIDIRTGARRLYFAALPGSSGDNEDWARRKANVSLRCNASSFRVGLTLKSEDRKPWPDAMLDVKDYAAHGGGFPVRVRGTGVVAAIGVSGLPSREDHDLIVAALTAHLQASDVPATPEVTL